MHHDNVLTKAEIEELASTFTDLTSAARVLDEAGFPAGRVPGWSVHDSQTFWWQVSKELRSGLLEDGRRRLLAAAAARYPMNPVFAAWKVPPATDPAARITPPEEEASQPDTAATATKKWDFLVAYADADQSWAEWVSHTLHTAGYTVHVQAWELVAGKERINVLEDGIRQSTRTIVLLSKNFLNAPKVQAQWHAAWDSDPQGVKRTLLPVRLENVALDGLLRGIVHIDLVGLDGARAEETLLTEVRASLLGQRPRPPKAPPFPGGS